MFRQSGESGISCSTLIDENEVSEDVEIEESDKGMDFCRVMEDLIGSKERFDEIGTTEESIISFGDAFSHDQMEEKLEHVQISLFARPTFVQEKKVLRKRAQKTLELKHIQQKTFEEELKKKAAENTAKGFQFDFGHLDAEVHDLLQQLERVYPDVSPMPNTSTTKSIYTSTKVNVGKLNLKVILNRLCLIGKYNLGIVKEPSNESTPSADEDLKFANDVQKTLIEELRRIRSRADSVFAAELGEITGCLLTYPDYFIVMMEGPEISIMDVVYQSKQMLNQTVSQGSVLFVAGHVMVRYLQDWTDLIMSPPDAARTANYDTNVDNAKSKLVFLGEICQALWRFVGKSKSSGTDPMERIPYDMLPDEKLIRFSMECGLLRPLHTWLIRVTQVSVSHVTNETWPQIFYPFVFSSFKPDTQFDSLGILESYEGMPGQDPELEEFLRRKVAWKLKENLPQDLEDLTKTLREKLVKQGSITSVLTAISNISRYDNEHNAGHPVR